MKKLLAVALALAMLCAVALAETAEVVGEWYLIEARFGDTVLPTAALGMEMTLTFNEDGTGTMLSPTEEGDRSAELAWKLVDEGIEMTVQTLDEEGNAKEETAVVTLEDGQLLMNEEGGSLVFSRDAAEAPALPAPVAAESEEAFLGVWNMSTVNMNGIPLPAATFGMEGTLTVEVGKAVMGDSEEADEYATEFVDGILKLSREEETLNLELYDDGSVGITQQLDEETTMAILFVKAAE